MRSLKDSSRSIRKKATFLRKVTFSFPVKNDKSLPNEGEAFAQGSHMLRRSHPIVTMTSLSDPAFCGGIGKVQGFPLSRIRSTPFSTPF